MSCGIKYRICIARIFKIKFKSKRTALFAPGGVFSLSYNVSITDMIAYEAENSLSVVGCVVFIACIVLLAEDVVIVEGEDIPVYIAETCLVHLGDRVLGKIGIELRGIFYIPREFSAEIGVLRNHVQPVGLGCSVCVCPEITAAAHITVVVQAYAVKLGDIYVFLFCIR